MEQIILLQLYFWYFIQLNTNNSKRRCKSLLYPFIYYIRKSKFENSVLMLCPIIYIYTTYSNWTNHIANRFTNSTFFVLFSFETNVLSKLFWNIFLQKAKTLLNYCTAIIWMNRILRTSSKCLRFFLLYFRWMT